MGSFHRGYKLVITVGFFLSFAFLNCMASPADKQSEDQDKSSFITLTYFEKNINLPKSLVSVIKDKFSGFRIPSQEDLSGPWRFDWENKLPPFLVKGYFNNDDLIDFGVILLSEKQWKFVIFEKEVKNYIPAYSETSEINRPGALIEYPQEISLSVMKKGEKVTVLKDLGTKDIFPVDSIEFAVFEKGLSIIHWEKGKYQSIDLFE